MRRPGGPQAGDNGGTLRIPSYQRYSPHSYPQFCSRPRSVVPPDSGVAGATATVCARRRAWASGRTDRTTSVPELSPGDVFAGHRVEGLAGRGGMGVVYRATQLDLDRLVALKLIVAQLAEDPEFRDRFVRESRAAASIDHPNVIPIYYMGESDGALYIAMRYVEGDDLRTLARREGRLAPDRAAHIVSQVGSALDAAHARGIVHRDVKPANVLLGPEDHAYLTDFGLTKRLHSHTASTRSGGWVGTLGYVAPEQIRGERVDARSD